MEKGQQHIAMEDGKFIAMTLSYSGQLRDSIVMHSPGPDSSAPARKLRKRRRPVYAGQMELPFAEPAEPLRGFWQVRFYDSNVYGKGKKTEKLNYMHANPVIRGLCARPRLGEWVYQSR